MAYWETSAEIAGLDGAPDPAQSLDRWKRAAYDRENLPRKEVAAVIERAKAANWAGGKKGDVARSHYGKHANRLNISDQRAYN